MKIYGQFMYGGYTVSLTEREEGYVVEYHKDGRPLDITVHDGQFAFGTARSHFENCVRKSLAQALQVLPIENGSTE